MQTAAYVCLTVGFVALLVATRLPLRPVRRYATAGAVCVAAFVLALLFALAAR